MNKRNLRNGLLFISPWIIGFLVFTLYPVCSSFYYSLTDYNMISNPQFVGLANYTALFQDPTFLTALGNTVYKVVIGITIITVATVTIAILLNNKRLEGLSVFRVVFFLPTLVPTVVLSLLWIWILDPQSGVINTLLGYVDIRGPGWLADPHWTKPAFILMFLWGSGNAIIIYLAGLQDISPSLYELASVDGANALEKASFITIPMLRPMIVFNIITGMIGMFQSFAEAFIMTNGGPNNASLFYSLNLYRTAFQYFKIGYASAMGWTLLVIVLICTIAIDKTQATYMGNPCPARAKLAFFHLPNIDIELIEPDHQPSTWRDYLNEHGEGVHHIAFNVKGMQDVISRFGDQGSALLQKGEYTGGRYAYIDTTIL